jgi:two-component system C4-dicarboxylate transport sensor histidine kinase DctB
VKTAEVGTELAAAHARFARAAMSIFVGTAAVALGLLVVSLATDLEHQKKTALDMLSLETQVRSHYLTRHLQLLADELTRLGMRSEVNLLDENMEPERSLLRLTHEKSAFFDMGVAILDRDRAVAWSEPQTFLAPGARPVEEGAFADLKQSRAVRVVATQWTPGAPVLYVVSPILRNGRFTGALLGGIDPGTLLLDRRAGTLLALFTEDGGLVYPLRLPFNTDPVWQAAGSQPADPFAFEVELGGRRQVVAGAPVHDTGFTLLSLTDADALFGPARRRLATRLALGLALASLPLLLVAFLLRRSLRAFWRAEEDAVRGERLRLLGEAVDLIAHEVKNSLNGLRMGLDLILQGDHTGLEARQRRAVTGLRQEMERLSNFTSELLFFSKGVVPRPVSLDLAQFVPKVTELARDAAEAQGVALKVVPADSRVPVRADPALVHVVIANLVGNAVNFAAVGEAAPPWVEVRVTTADSTAGVLVRDSGPGVAPSVKARLFEPFVTGKPNGVGIGLALSRRIARAHGGDLVHEEVPAGAAFRLILPREAR